MPEAIIFTEKMFHIFVAAAAAVGVVIQETRRKKMPTYNVLPRMLQFDMTT